MTLRPVEPEGHEMAPPWTALAALLADLDSQHRGERQAYEHGYRDGHWTGWEIGYGHAHHEMNECWQALTAHVRQLANAPTHDELEERRWNSNREEVRQHRPIPLGARCASHTDLAAPSTPTIRIA